MKNMVIILFMITHIVTNPMANSVEQKYHANSSKKNHHSSTVKVYEVLFKDGTIVKSLKIKGLGCISKITDPDNNTQNFVDQRSEIHYRTLKTAAHDA